MSAGRVMRLRPIGRVAREQRIVVAIVMLAFLARVGAAVALRTWEDRVNRENGGVARSIAAGHGFRFDHGEGAISHYHTSDHPAPTSFRGPFYPYLLAGFYMLGRHVGADAALVLLLILQSAVGAALVVPVFRIGHRLFGKDAALLAAAIAAVYPSFVYSATVLQQGVWCVTGFSAGFLALLRLRYQPAFGPAVTCGVLLGVLLLIEPAFPVLLAAAFAGLVIISRARRQLTLAAGASLVIAALIVSPWLLGRYLVHGRFVLEESSRGLSLWQGDTAASDRSIWQSGLGHWPSPGLSDSRSPLDDTDTESERDGIGREASVRNMTSNHGGTARLGERVILFWVVWPYGGAVHNLWYGAPYALLLVLAVAAAVSMRRWLRQYLPALAVLAAATLIYALAGGGPEERMPFEPLLFLFSAEGGLLPMRFARARARRKGSVSCLGQREDLPAGVHH